MNRTLVIEPGDAVAHGLPPARIAIDLDDSPLFPTLFPGADTYVSLSGPPGGPLFFRVHSVPRAIADDAALQALVRDIHAGGRKFTLGAPGAIELNGTACRALLFFTGEQLGACANVALLIPPPENRASAPGLLLIFGHGGAPDWIDSVFVVASHAPLAHFLETLKWDLAIDSADRKRTAVDPPNAVQPENSAAPAGGHEEFVVQAAASDETVSALKQAIHTAPEVDAAEDDPAPKKMQRYSARAMAVYFGEIEEKLKEMGCWQASMPSQEAYGTMSSLQQQMWTLQSTLQAVAPTIQGTLQFNPEASLFGMLGMFDGFKTVLATETGAAPLLSLLERGPRE